MKRVLRVSAALLTIFIELFVYTTLHIKTSEENHKNLFPFIPFVHPSMKRHQMGKISNFIYRYTIVNICQLRKTLFTIKCTKT